MLQNFFPREKDFFAHFEKLTSGLTSSISELILATQSADHCQKAVEETLELERQAEILTRTSIETLHETFITPFDRRHIFQFVIQLKTLHSSTRLITEKLNAYQLGALPQELSEIANQTGKACATLNHLIDHLKKLKKPYETLKLCLEIYRIRAKIEALHFQLFKALYQGDSDLKKLMQFKELGENFVEIARKFENLSFLIEEIILEYA